MAHCDDDIASTTSNNGGFNKDKIERLRTLLSSIDKPSASCSLAQSGKYLISHSFRVSKDYCSRSWIINSSTTDNMTYCPTCFTTYNPCFGH